jgi:murein L,D-transpeptidase YcbB/YkuD
VIDPQTIDWAVWMEPEDDHEEADEESSDADIGDVARDDAPAEEFPYRFRQRPGTSNSLGLVKFLFPNAFDVYLHDTPASALFKRRYRALSHGCVRVEEPVQLAEHLLRHDRAWTRKRIEKAMRAGDETHVKLDEPIPVHLMYWTATARENGEVAFFADIYGYDARQWDAYRARVQRVKRKKEALPGGVEEWIRAASARAGARPAAAPR